MNGDEMEYDTLGQVSTKSIDALVVKRLSSLSNDTILKEYGDTKQDLEIETFDLIAKVIELLTTHELWEPDGTYTFADGECWAQLKESTDESE